MQQQQLGGEHVCFIEIKRQWNQKIGHFKSLEILAYDIKKIQKL